MVAVIATDTDRQRAIEVIVDAFHRDPLWSWICPDPLRRRDHHAQIFGLYVDTALPREAVWMTDAECSAAAVFTPPGEPELTEEAEAKLEPIVRSALGAHAEDVLETFARFEAAVPSDPPFYYLSLLGTDPASRGRGLGMALLAEIVELADRDGRPTYLESSNPANNKRYERLGFRVRDRFSTPDDAHTVTTMWREPA